MALQHLRSSTANKRPTPAAMSDGQIALNSNTASPGLFFKDSAGALIKVGPVHVGTTAPNASPASGGETGNTVGEQWLDTTGGTYVFKVWDGSAWRSETGTFVDVNGDTMTGALGIIAGDAATPGLFVSGDTNTGIYSPGADQLAISTNGTGRLFVDASGNVGVGTTSPGSVLEAKSADQNPNIFRLYNAYNAGASSWGVDFYRDTDSGNNQAVAEIKAIRTGGNPSDLKFGTSTTPGTVVERLRITSDGKLGLGTSSPAGALHVDAASGVDGPVFDSGGTANSNHALLVRDSANNQLLRVNNDGKVGIGTTSPGYSLDVNGSINIADNQLIRSGGQAMIARYSGSNAIFVGSGTATDNLVFSAGGNEKARIDTSGRLLVGTSSALTAGSAANASVQIVGRAGAATDEGRFVIARGQPATAPLIAGNIIGRIFFTDNVGNEFATVKCEVDSTSGSGDYPGRLVFSTTADGAPDPTERMRIKNDGVVLIATTDTNVAGGGAGTYGTRFSTGGSTTIQCANATASVAAFNRSTNDGDVVEIRQGGTLEGSISVSGSSVTLNGAHLSRWSQLVGIDPYDKTARPEILRGTVMSNLDEMCDWTCPTSGDCQDNEQLNKTEISSVDDDPNVAGVFQSWDDDDDTWVNDFYLAMTGDFVIRIAAGTTVQRGDLLCSAGDGTARPQGDRYIKGSTIAKVTSTTVSCTHPDGSYCVPCVLMAC